MSMIHIEKYNEGITGPNTIRNAKVVQAINDLAKIKRQEAELKTAKDQLNDLIGDFHLAKQVRKFHVPGAGTVNAYQGTSTKFDKTKLATYLVKQGVDVDLIEAAIDKATKVSVNSKVTVRLTLE